MGHLGRLVVFTKDAFESLDNIFGTYRERGVQKGGFQLGRNMMSCADLARIINSDQIQSKLRMQRVNTDVSSKGKKNPLKNKTLMQRLNPNSKAARAAEEKAVKARKKEKAVRTKRHNALEEGLEESFRVAHQVIMDEIKAGLIDQASSEEEEDEDDQ